MARRPQCQHALEGSGGGIAGEASEGEGGGGGGRLPLLLLLLLWLLSSSPRWSELHGARTDTAGTVVAAVIIIVATTTGVLRSLPLRARA